LAIAGGAWNFPVLAHAIAVAKHRMPKAVIKPFIAASLTGSTSLR
jgi:hypothetical protein